MRYLLTVDYRNIWQFDLPFRYNYSDRIYLLFLMFCAQRPKAAVPTPSLAKSVDGGSDQFPQSSNAGELRKKIETRQSTFSHALKSSIISDCEYTSTIYEWRKIETAPIVKVIELAKRSEID